MRKDMSKVIVERPRRGRAWASEKRPGRSAIVEDDDGEPLRAGRGGRAPKRTKPLKTKGLNENLAPLRRYLGKQVGRPWNKVFSEISEHLKPTSTVQQHVRDHIDDFVAVQTRMRAGKVVITGKWGGERALEEDYRRHFVHPRTGLLKDNPHYRSWSKRVRDKRAAAAAERDARMRVIDAKTQLHKLKDDVWWEVKLGKLGRGLEPDVVLAARLSDMPPEKLYARPGARAIAKRQLSKADKKRFGLS
jgi:hypothetical protein